MSRLAEIRERAEATVPGPWRWFGNTEANSIFLGTDHSGRLYLVSPRVRVVETVFDHDDCEVYTLAEMRQRHLIDPAIAPPAGRDYFALTLKELATLAEAREIEVMATDGEGPIEDDYADALIEYDAKHGYDSWWAEPEAQARLRHFLDGELTIEEGARHLGFDGVTKFSRGLQHAPELFFFDHDDHRLTSYRDIARYEVLSGRTAREHAAGGFQGDLYREDIVGVDNPAAEFIAHSRDDVDYLLNHVEQLGRALRSAARLLPPERPEQGGDPEWLAEEKRLIHEMVETLPPETPCTVCGGCKTGGPCSHCHSSRVEPVEVPPDE